MRGIYDRGTQRRAEQWSAVSRAASWLFARPELLLAVLGSPPPVENDGRVLSRGVQAALSLLENLPNAEETQALGPATDVAVARAADAPVGRLPHAAPHGRLFEWSGHSRS